MSAESDLACWECGKAAPGGVCVGPHEGFSMAAARSRGMVGPSSGTNVKPVRTWLCEECGQWITALGIGSHQRAHARRRAHEAQLARAQASQLRREIRRALREEEESRWRRERATDRLRALEGEGVGR